MEENKSSKSKNFGDHIGGLAFLLTLIFASLRACDVIAWEWWQVMMPLLIYVGIVAVLIIVGLILIAVDLSLSNLAKD